MPSLAQGLGRGMLLGLRLQEAEDEREQQRLRGERQRIQDERTGLLSRLTQIQIANWEKDQAEEKQQREMIDELQTMKDFYGGPQILQQMLQTPTTPPETKRRMRGLSETFPGMITGYEPPRLTGREAGKAQRIKAGLEPRAKAEGSEETYGEWFRGETTKTMLKDRAGEPAAREKKLKDYYQKFLTAWGKELDEEAKDTPEEKFKFFRKWRDQNVLPGYKNELGKRLGFYNKSAGVSEGVNRVMGVPPPEKTKVTKEEDEFIAEARGKEDKINWDAIATKYPKWNIFYIKQKLGVNE